MRAAAPAWASVSPTSSEARWWLVVLVVADGLGAAPVWAEFSWTTGGALVHAGHERPGDEESDGDETRTHPLVSPGLLAGHTRQLRSACQSAGTLPSGPGTGCDSGWQAGGASSGPFDIRDVR